MNECRFRVRELKKIVMVSEVVRIRVIDHRWAQVGPADGSFVNLIWVWIYVNQYHKLLLVNTIFVQG